MNNITGFLFLFGAAIAVAIIILIDIFKKSKSVKPYAKWSTVFILSIWQVGCWRAMDDFGTAFGNSSSIAVYEIVFIAVVAIWFIVRITGHLKNRK